MRQYIKHHQRNDTSLWRIIAFIHNIFSGNKRRVCGKHNITRISGALLHKVSLTIAGDNNTIIIESGTTLTNVSIFVRGSGNKLLIGRFCGFKGELLFDDNDCVITIKDFTTAEGAHIAVTEPNSRIEIGYDCMLAQKIDVRTGDSHSIIDIVTKKRINFAKNVVIGDHVWIASDVKVLKGVSIGSHSIIATGSIVTKSIPENVVAAGSPAVVIRNNVTWDRMRIYD